MVTTALGAPVTTTSDVNSAFVPFKYNIYIYTCIYFCHISPYTHLPSRMWQENNFMHLLLLETCTSTSTKNISDKPTVHKRKRKIITKIIITNAGLTLAIIYSPKYMYLCRFGLCCGHVATIVFQYCIHMTKCSCAQTTEVHSMMI